MDFRINAQLSDQGVSYSKFINLFQEKQYYLIEKFLSQIAIDHEAFKKIIDVASK